ncbi:D-aminoacyl-tRNA deacylase [Mesoterricola sediminis]|uniref:D-aminoacyl-tRNA deacylase n=1 Tax=Mesoterricola sediminis TaxID=2927980 RepID=A0AA48GQ35_9BACT|nr:D-aminoacyl-tRNA deacylase [Mesoterricola sediminis]BDU77186.1 D-aminoacyl-tRNA deacylase [Mesoterricola sediminis]
MRAVIQRVKRARIQAGDQTVAIGPGLLVFAALQKEDTLEACRWAAAKIASLRVFDDGEGHMNRSLQETGGEILAVSQFTLAGSIAKGRRPSFDGAMAPAPARELFEAFVGFLEEAHPRVARGFFREHMEVELVNDGPATFILER